MLLSREDVDVDAAWYEQMPHVPVGETFEVEGVHSSERSVEAGAAAAQDANDAASEFEEDPAEVKLPTFITDHPDKPGESYYVTGAPLCNVRPGDDIDMDDEAGR